MKAQTAEPDARDYVEQPTDVVPLGAAPGTRFTYANGSRPLSGYTIKRGIGRGGFGEVYYAVSDGGKEVALKLLRRNFDIELRGVAQCLNLKHPHLLGLYDIRTDDGGDHWVVMEYVTGPSLDEIIAANPNGLPPVEAVAWLAGVAAGVGYLHQSGIVHRDLKPGNIFSDAGLVKIGDYGLAKFISCSRRSGQTESVGTVHYMAPEIAQGRYGKEIDVPFRSVVGRALAKDPQARFGSVEKMMAALPLAPHAGPAVIIPRHVPTAAAKSIPAVEATLNNSKPQEPIQRWVRDTLSGFGSAWQSQFNTPAKVVLILIGLWLVAVIGPVVAPVVVPLSVLTAIAYGAYFHTVRTLPSGPLTEGVEGWLSLERIPLGNRRRLAKGRPAFARQRVEFNSPRQLGSKHPRRDGLSRREGGHGTLGRCRH
ncbi:MAG: serine/threonine protein kinase [Planctomycetia bacterium]|nr:serine/threonine protein kinase [Planctomycetia bacterium]